MANPRLITAIDVGTTKVCVIVGVQDGSADPEVLAYSIVPCKGLKKGIVADREATARRYAWRLRTPRTRPASR